VILILANPGCHARQRHYPGFATHNSIVIFIKDVSEASVDFVDLRLTPERILLFEFCDAHVFFRLCTTHVRVCNCNVWQTGALNHSVRNVDSETCGTSVKPESQNVVKHFANLFVVPVQVRLR
jgi:hypothetical protein